MTENNNLIKTLQKTFNESANLLIDEIREKVGPIVHAKVDLEYEQVFKKIKTLLKEEADKNEKQVEALIEITAHVMVQNVTLTNLLSEKGIILAEDIKILEKDLDKNILPTIDYVRKSINELNK